MRNKSLAVEILKITLPSLSLILSLLLTTLTLGDQILNLTKENLIYPCIRNYFNEMKIEKKLDIIYLYLFRTAKLNEENKKIWNEVVNEVLKKDSLLLYIEK